MLEKILITGITGQDGLFLTKMLLSNNAKYHVYGTSRNIKNSFLERLRYLKPDSFDNLSLIEVDLHDTHSISELITEIKPTKLINLSGPSSVYKSYENPSETINSINIIFDNLVDSFFKVNIEGVFFQALSSEMFELNNNKIDEKSSINPRSPYAIGKSQIYEKSLNLREKEGVNVCNGFLFNHESEFRDDEYLIMKVINSAINISNKKQQHLKIGSLELVRDWTYAEDTTKAIKKIIENSYSKDYVVGSGNGYSIRELISNVFEEFHLDIDQYVTVEPSLLREGDPKSIISNPTKIYNELGWRAETSLKSLILKCLEFKLKKS